MAKRKRIQRQRTRGWRLPEGARCVTRPGPFGNPFDVRREADGWYVGIYGTGEQIAGPFETKADATATAVVMFRRWVRGSADCDFPQLRERRARLLKELPRLVGLDLACFCALPEDGTTDWCHARELLDAVAELIGNDS